MFLTGHSLGKGASFEKLKKLPNTEIHKQESKPRKETAVKVYKTHVVKEKYMQIIDQFKNAKNQ